MSETSQQKRPRARGNRTLPAVSAVLPQGTLVELVYARDEDRTGFAVWQDGDWRIMDRVRSAGRILVPYAADNALLANNVVLFPSKPADYGSQDRLVEEVRAFIHRYVDVSGAFERLAAYYVCFTWVFDNFNEVPYLRVRGDYGTGKTRFLQTVGSLCYHPIFASGASTLSPIFHMLDAFGGTLIIDEADFRYSDATADMVKIFNNGNVRGIPVLRSRITRSREFEPRMFQVFGPKIVATRGGYDDRGLESRFITEQTDGRGLRADIPINLPSAFEEEALALRNKLLLYRFEHWGRYRANDKLVDPSIEPRLNQIFVPLLSIVEDDDARDELRTFARQCNERRGARRHDIQSNDIIWVPLDDREAEKCEGSIFALRNHPPLSRHSGC